MSNPRFEFKTGPYLFGDVTATRHGAIWHIETKPSLWYRVYCVSLLTCMKMYSPSRDISGSNQPE